MSDQPHGSCSPDEHFMRRALELAMRGSGHVNPNPLVGAVIVRDGHIIGEGWHTAFGHPHAEREAFAHCTEDPSGATLYVTLEPCCHTGKTPPCTDAVIEHGIARVVVGAPDPNPQVDGGGVAQLRAAGIKVDQGVCLEECWAINRPFFHFIQTGRPYVIVKYAMTLDGKIATRTGASRWITGEQARTRVHEDRCRYAAVMVGVGTVLTDDPQLTCRLEGVHGVDPVRVICDSRLRTPLSSILVSTARQTSTLIVTCVEDEKRLAPYRAAGCDVIVLPAEDTGGDLPALMDELGKRGIDSVVVEGGATLAWAVIAVKLARRIQCYVAPKLFGGTQAPSPLGGDGVATPAEALALERPEVVRLGNDLLIECEVI